MNVRGRGTLVAWDHHTMAQRDGIVQSKSDLPVSLMINHCYFFELDDKNIFSCNGKGTTPRRMWNSFDPTSTIISIRKTARRRISRLVRRQLANTMSELEPIYCEHVPLYTVP